MPECPDCETAFIATCCPTCGWRPPVSQAAPAPVSNWRLLSGPPLSKDQNAQCAAIFKAVLEGRMPRVEGVNRICDLARSWGMPIEDQRIHEAPTA